MQQRDRAILQLYNYASALIRFVFIVAVLFFLTIGNALALSGETALLSDNIITEPDPGASISRGFAPYGSLRFRVDRYGSVCLIGSGVVSRCGFIISDSVEAVRDTLMQAMNYTVAAPGEIHILGSFLTDMPVRPGTLPRQTGIEIGSTEANSRNFIVITVHDAQVGGGGQYFLSRTGAEKFARVLERIPGIAEVLDKRLKRQEEAAQRSYRDHRQDNGGIGENIFFRLLPLLSLFI